MQSKFETSLEIFLREKCKLEGDSLISVISFLAKMGIKTNEELENSKTTTNDLVQMGLPIYQAVAIMENCKRMQAKQYKYFGPIFPRLASKYLTIQIAGFAFVQIEAIDFGYLCKRARLHLIRDFSLFKKELTYFAEKRKIKSIFELLDNRLISKMYKLCYAGSDSEKDLNDCMDIYKGRLQFQSFIIKERQISFMSHFLPWKVTIDRCKNIPYLFANLPHSVTCLNLFQVEGAESQLASTQTPRNFKKLKLSGLHTLFILKYYATTNQSLFVNANCLKHHGVIDYIKQMDCIQIIVQTHENTDNFLQIKDFIYFKQDATKYIELKDAFLLSLLNERAWVFEHI
ncbi:hypothetical protein FGO68_gene17474 [Halteria grandinella]|uniref:Uncharacterized protein n=1 Tax=Halteria grandinella TaxID=5974 RepID=A0A8J8NZ46_HALGN|nr:hypothetical protein FGO68_gene17474 [Halteria grandinella]